MPAVIDITGQEFGYLRVLRRSEKADRAVWWECLCKCGNQTVKRSQEIRQGKASCGCRSLDKKRAGRLPGNRGLWHQAIRKYRRNADERGFVWDLTDDAAIELMESDCAYCKSPPSTYLRHSNDNSGRFILRNGIDRVDNALGYVPGNVVSCCRDCNVAKGAMTTRDFLVWVHRIARFTKEPPIDHLDVSEVDRSRHPVIDDVLELFEDLPGG